MNKISTDKAPAAIGPYSQALVHQGLVYSSGQIPLSPVTGEVVGTTIAEQTHQALDNLGAVLTAAGSSLDKVLKTTAFLSDMANFASFNEVYSGYFINHPARSCVAVKDLPKGVLVEVECIAVVE